MAAQTRLTAHLKAEFADADPKLLALLQALITENTDIRQSVADLESQLRAAYALADRDPLCPVLNRRAFCRELDREIALANRHGRALSLLFIDVDQFKHINDSQGHGAGDRILVAMAQTLLKTVRKTDIVCRLGGDEFGVLLIETDKAKADICAADLGKRIVAEGLGITASIGAATWQKGQSADALMASADRDMFYHKTGSD